MRELRSALRMIACTVVAALAMHDAIAAPLPGDLQVFQTNLDANTGQYTLVNHSTGWSIYEFFVANPNAGTPGEEPTTSQNNWAAMAGSCFAGSFNCLDYANKAGGTVAELPTDLGPGVTSDRFFASPAPALAIDYGLNLIDALGVLGNVAGVVQDLPVGAAQGLPAGAAAQDLAVGVPEPASLSLLVAGLALLGFARRRLRVRSS